MTPKKKKTKKKKIILFLFFLLLLWSTLYFLKDKLAAVSTITIDKQNGYKLLVNGQPYLIRGFVYHPIPIGKDYEYNFWGDPNRPWLTDGKLMEQMGANTVRFYKPGKNPSEVKRVLTDLHRRFGLRVMMGTYLGFWSWPPPDYADEDFREKVRAETLEMVRLYKDHPAILVWVLGNENNYSFDRSVQRWSSEAIDALPDAESQRQERARIYYSFVNDLARDIKKIDPKHPVVLGIGEVTSLDSAGKEAKDIDIVGIIAYRGPTFGNLFRQVKQEFDLPVILIEAGADSFNAVTGQTDDRNQAEFLKHQWLDIERNADPKKGVGNCLGGVFFEWSDEWWKANENLPHTWSVQDTSAQWGNGSYYYDSDVRDHLNINEEWFGTVALDPRNTKNGVDQRLPKRSYAVLKSLWTRKHP